MPLSVLLAQAETSVLRVDSVLAQQSVPVGQGMSDAEGGGAGEELVVSGSALVAVGGNRTSVVGGASPRLRVDPHPTTSHAANAKSEV